MYLGPVPDELELLRAASAEECHMHEPASVTRTVSPLANSRGGNRSAATGPDMAFEALMLGDGRRVGNKRVELGALRLPGTRTLQSETLQRTQ